MTTCAEFESIAALEAIGAASPEESASLRAHVEACPDCAYALDEYAEAATLLSRQLEPVTPPGDMRSRILEHTLDEHRAADDAGNVVDGGGRFNWWLATAATLFLALWGWRELSVHAAKSHIRDQEATIQQLTDQNNLLAAQREKLATEMTALAGADTRTIALAGQIASARVFLEPKTRRAVVFFYHLPANANDKSYQLWVIRSDQPTKPQSAGVFSASSDGRATVTVENLPLDVPIKAFAVTLEPRGGVDQPTNSNFVVMGGT